MRIFSRLNMNSDLSKNGLFLFVSNLLLVKIRLNVLLATSDFRLHADLLNIILLFSLRFVLHSMLLINQKILFFIIQGIP